jgi:hypothetical protein
MGYWNCYSTTTRNCPKDVIHFYQKTLLFAVGLAGLFLCSKTVAMFKHHTQEILESCGEEACCIRMAGYGAIVLKVYTSNVFSNSWQ